MSQIHRLSRIWKAALSGRSLDARVRLVPRAAAGLVALLLTFAIAGELLAARRLSDLQRDTYPALHETRDLSSTLAAIHGELSVPTSTPASSASTDSLAGRFHAIARDSRSPGVASADIWFNGYFADARRAAGPTAAATELAAYRALAAELSAQTALAEQQIADGFASARSIQSVIAWTLAIAGIGTLVMLTMLGIASSESVDETLDDLTETVDAAAAGEERAAPPAEESGAAARLHGSLRRLAHQVRANSDTAHALAAGAFRRAAHARIPEDPTGRALALLATNMEAIVSSARCIARGDLRDTVTPQSPDDAFAHAHVAMAHRIAAMLGEVDATRSSIAATIEQMRGDAAALAATTTEDTDRLRRTVDRLTAIALQAEANAARGTTLAERAAESDEMLRRGTTALEASHSGLRDAVGKSASVQRLARDAGLLAVRAATAAGRARGAAADAGSLDDDARTLAKQAAAATRDIVHTVIDGSHHAYAAGVAIDRVAIAVQDGNSFVRDVSLASRAQSDELMAIDEAIVQIHGTTVRNADTARTLLSRVESLSSQSRRLDSMLGRLRRTTHPAVAALDPRASAPQLVLHKTPPHAHVLFPKLALTGQ